jgi:hypothetical protein
MLSRTLEALLQVSEDFQWSTLDYDSVLSIINQQHASVT